MSEQYECMHHEDAEPYQEATEIGAWQVGPLVDRFGRTRHKAERTPSWRQAMAAPGAIIALDLFSESGRLSYGTIVQYDTDAGRQRIERSMP